MSESLEGTYQKVTLDDIEMCTFLDIRKHCKEKNGLMLFCIKASKMQRGKGNSGQDSIRRSRGKACVNRILAYTTTVLSTLTLSECND